jgi:hypothetical protein
MNMGRIRFVVVKYFVGSLLKNRPICTTEHIRSNTIYFEIVEPLNLKRREQQIIWIDLLQINGSLCSFSF